MQLTAALSTLILLTTTPLALAAPAADPQCCEALHPPQPPPPPPCSAPHPRPPNPHPNPHPQPPPAQKNATFGLMALRSASPIHFASIIATSSGLQLNTPQTGAVCSSSSSSSSSFSGGRSSSSSNQPTAATFLHDNSTQTLFLYNGADSYQQLYTDRSGMGQGVLQYTKTRGQALNPNRIETTGFVIPAGSPDLQFKDTGFVACPGLAGGGWSVWVSAGVANPGGNQGCLGFSARVVETTDLVACVYS